MKLIKAIVRKDLRRIILKITDEIRRHSSGSQAVRLYASMIRSSLERIHGIEVEANEQVGVSAFRNAHPFGKRYVFIRAAC